MYEIKQSTAVTIPIFAHNSSGVGVTGLLTGDWTKWISKASGAFGAMTVVITEMAGGWYGVALTTAHTDTVGILSMYFTHASCLQVNIQFRVNVRLPDDRAFPEVSGRAFDVTSGGNVGIDLDNTVGTLAKGTEVTGFTDITVAQVESIVSLALAAYDGPTKAELDSVVAAHSASLALAAYDPPTKAEVDSVVALYSASVALAVYDAPTKAEMDSAFSALNDITVAEVWAYIIDTLAAPAVTIHADDALKWVVAYASGNVAKASTAFAYADGAGATLWTNDIATATRTRS
jgi:hypothetical protein